MWIYVLAVYCSLSPVSFCFPLCIHYSHFLFVWYLLKNFLKGQMSTYLKYFLAVHFGEPQTHKWLQLCADTSNKSMDASNCLMFSLSYKSTVSEHWGGGGTSQTTYLSSSRVLWSRASRGFPVRSSSCSFGGRFSGKVTSLSSLQLRSTHWRNKWRHGGLAWRSCPGGSLPLLIAEASVWPFTTLHGLNAEK